MHWLVPFSSPAESVQVTTKPPLAKAATWGFVSVAVEPAPTTVVGDTTLVPVSVLIVKKTSRSVGLAKNGLSRTATKLPFFRVAKSERSLLSVLSNSVIADPATPAALTVRAMMAQSVALFWSVYDTTRPPSAKDVTEGSLATEVDPSINMGFSRRVSEELVLTTYTSKSGPLLKLSVNATAKPSLCPAIGSAVASGWLALKGIPNALFSGISATSLPIGFPNASNARPTIAE